MANGEDYDGLEQAAGGDVRPTAELVGRTFELLDFEQIPTRWEDEKTGEKRHTQIATLILDGEELRYWLGGVLVSRQLSWAKTTGRLPMTMKLGGQGNQDSPYKLVRPDEETPLVTAGKAAGAKVVGRSKDALAGFRDNDGTVDTKGFGRFWQEQNYGLDELRGIIGPLTASALEHWFKVNKGKTVDDLLTLAMASRGDAAMADQEVPEEEPFE